MAEPREIKVTLTECPDATPKGKWAGFAKGFESFSRIISIAAVPVVLAISGSMIDGSIKKQSLSREYVQLAVSVLEEPDTNKVKPGLRSWAADLLNKESPIPLAPDLLKELKSGATTLPESNVGLVDLPPKGTINNGLHEPSVAFLLSVLGKPGELTPDCSPITNPRLKDLVVTADVGPFKTVGLKPATDALTRIFARVKEDHPDLYASVGSAGMLCVRAVRGSRGSFSNHAWGIAIDLTVGGILAPTGQSRVPKGLQVLYPYFKAEKFMWGAGEARPNSMHFTASEELVRDWVSSGVIPSQ